MFFYLYQITNLANDKVYIGVHQTTNVDDGYMGSGHALKRAKQKYGIALFRKDILEFFDSREAMLNRERQVVTEDFVQRSDVYNIKCGGVGGFNDLTKQLALDALKVRRQQNCDDWHQKIGESNRKVHAGGNRKPQNYDASSHNGRIAAASAESKTKRKTTYDQICHQQGPRNSQFGTCWITKDHVNKKIPVADLDHWLDSGWNRGRVIK